MSDREPEEIEPDEVDSDDEYEDEEPAATPFDNPYFLPAVLWGLAIWFGFDIVTNAPAYQEWPNFNRGGLAIFGLAAVWFTRSAILEKRAEKDSNESN